MKKITLFKKQFLSVILLLVSSFSIGQTLDQSNAPEDNGGGTFTISPSANVGQSFTAGLTGKLSQINIRIGNYNSYFVAGDFQLRIFSGNDYSGTVLNTTSFTIATAPASNNYDELVITLSSVVNVTAGSAYTIDLRGITGTVNTHGTNPPNYTAGGFYFSNGGNLFYNSYDLWFKTFVIVPIPSSALNFDGINDVATINNTLGNFGTGDFTIQMSVKADIAHPSTYLLSKRGICDQDNFLSISIFEGIVYVETFDVNVAGSSLGGSGTIVSDYTNWHKIAFTRIAGTIRTYIDGVLDIQLEPTTTANANVNLNNSYVLQLGGNAPCTPYAGNTVFNGNMDEVRFWNRGLSQCEIITNSNSDLVVAGQTDLTAYYNFNQGIGSSSNATVTTLIDSSGNGNDGTLNNFSLTDGTTSNWVTDLVPANTATITPTFTQVAPICSGETLVALPLTSNNGVTGTWSPSLDNTTSTTYTFTPNSGQCGATASMTIAVNPNTSSTTTVAACDSYTWAANDTTYTTSGIYTNVIGCNTETLNLTINTIDKTITVVNNILTAAENGATYIWGICETVGSLTPILSATNQSFEATTSGNYYVQITKNDCVINGNCSSVNVLSNESFDASNFNYYPNPTNGILNINYSSQITKIELTNILGQQVLSQNINAKNAKIDLHFLPTETYIIKVFADNTFKTVKVIKQ